MKFKRTVEKSKQLLGAGRRRMAEGSAALSQKARQLLEWVVPDPKACRHAAAKLRTDHPDLTDKQLAFLHLRQAQKSAAKVGGATGLLANPVAMMTAAAGDAAYMLKLEGKLVGELAAILDPSSLEDPEAFRADVLAVVFPAAASQALRAATNLAAEQASRWMVRKMMTRDVAETAARLAVRRLAGQFAERALTKAVPLAGIAIGAGWNWFEVRKIGRRAVAYYTQAE